MNAPLLAATLTPVPGTVTINTIVVAVVILLHIQIAAYLIGSSTLTAIGEGISIATGDPHHERLAHMQVKSWAYIFGFGGALAIFFVVFILMGLWGRFFVGLQQITFWIFVFEAGAFVAEIALLYTLYASWDKLAGHRYARLGMVIMLNIAQWWQMFFIDAVASYMLTPNNGDISYLRQILNPTDLPLTIHRTIGNVAWAGAVIAFISGVRYLRVTRRQEAEALTPGHHATAPAVGAMPEGALVAERDREAAHWDWAGQWGLMWAFTLTLLQAWIGYSYAKEIQLHSYDSWYSMMFGWISTIFEGQLTLFALILILGSAYMWRRLRAAGAGRVARRHGIATVLLILVTLFSIQPAWFAWSYPDAAAAHLDRPFWEGGVLNPFGNFIPWKVGGLFAMVLIGLYTVTSYARYRIRKPLALGTAGRRSQWLLIGVGVCVSLMMMVMGIIREGARSPYLIHGQVTIDQQEIVSGSTPQSNSQQTPPP